MASKTFTVEEIHCVACEASIRKALGRLNGVSESTPAAATNQVTVVFDDARVDADTIAERLVVAGYPVTG
ncbi:MAG: heavy-metal-associated domain-containing protein [Acidimicrobiales bacterium]